MTTWFISRHPGAIAWAHARQSELNIDQFVSHLDPKIISRNDVVIGSLPVNLAAQVCEHGAKYFHLSIAMPFELRGHELSAEQLNNLEAKLVCYNVQSI